MENHYNASTEYFRIKDVAKRRQLLNQLLCDMPDDSKELFLNIFKKERYLDMKLSAVRGYAAYASEDEVNELMYKLLGLLKKRPESTPYDYQEYEPMRSVFLMPYLLEKYGYECFRVFAHQLEKQYNAMPDCFRDIFTLDEKGNVCSIRDPEEVLRSWEDFFGRR